MGVLENKVSGRRVALRARHLVGRSRACHLSIDSRQVSGEHAAVGWTGSEWQVRDLGSRNGTMVDGRALDRGEREALNEGAVLAFGDEGEAWQLISASAPTALAATGERWVEGEGEMLGLPSLEDPTILVTQDGGGTWWIGEEVAKDLQRIEVGGDTWVLHLPELLPPTMEGRVVRMLDDIALRFGVSADEEYVEVTVVVGAERVALTPRAHHELLLTLARQRIEDASAGGSAAEHGWVYADRLLKMLRWSNNQLYVGIHRARKELEGLEVMDASAVIERRASTRQVRLGVAELQVVAL
jgi:hypothetical protein